MLHLIRVIVLQVIGVIIFVTPLIIAFQRMRQQRSGKTLTAYVGLCFAAAFFGLPLIFNEGLNEFTTPFASIKVAKHQDADAIPDLGEEFKVLRNEIDSNARKELQKGMSCLWLMRNRSR